MPWYLKKLIILRMRYYDDDFFSLKTLEPFPNLRWRIQPFSSFVPLRISCAVQYFFAGECLVRKEMRVNYWGLKLEDHKEGTKPFALKNVKPIFSKQIFRLLPPENFCEPAS